MDSKQDNRLGEYEKKIQNQQVQVMKASYITMKALDYLQGNEAWSINQRRGIIMSALRKISQDPEKEGKGNTANIQGMPI